MKQYIMALDQGTTSSRCIIFDKQGNMKSVAQKEFTQVYPKPGWVEHDPMEIWSSQISVATEAMAKLGIDAKEIAAIGITNQRETTIVWNKHTGQPVHNAIVWQCRRTADMIEELKAKGLEPYIKEKTGLIPDAYFSGTKIKWILDHVPGAREKAKEGELLFGTVDTWIIWNLTKGKTYVTDYTNASRTMLYDIKKLTWDTRLLEELDIPLQMLPEVKPSSCVYGYSDSSLFGEEIPIAGAAGDQQSALFGQCCFSSGEVKNTYGTGCFLLMNTGKEAITSRHGLLTTIAAGTGAEVEYALEGSVFVAGAAIQWLRDELQLIRTAAESEKYASQVEDTNGVYVVPAFTGLGAPYWDQNARGAIVGITRGCNRDHIIRATLESIAYQTYEVLKAMEADSNIRLKSLKVDGGACANRFLMQFQADILDTTVHKPVCIETTALGAAYLAGLAVGFWKDKEEIITNWALAETYQPNMTEDRRSSLLQGWKKAVTRSFDWEV
ncbi:glycerol kinase GlpK [Lachnospiraceae bacterium MD1]|jgi:glycerol kinase|uniref:Glycerol kinase n=1 Tax=Variimorphobacter saccharofermentans TaxID=2755051 RepID=A0A839K5U4_9FIRM|nr:glycerol kinase GlpK [Variimorphobacter saccharofermentans]MBB2184687.1 glycerol kinase GlpK [Variimorphobacter saccharofermentans]